jgi:hypothetical protein
MTFPRARLAVAASLFVAWLGYLLTLVLMSRHTIVLSRPQFLVAEMCVIAELTGDGGAPDEKVTIKNVEWSLRPGADALDAKKVRVTNLAEAGPQGYEGPGVYILPLKMQSRDKALLDATWVVPAIPASPGYVAAFLNVGLSSLGPGPDARSTARLASETLGLDLAEAQAKIDALAQQQPVVLKRNVPRERALDFLKRIEERKDLEAFVTGNDVRIYKLTPATREQLDEIRAAIP